MSGSPIRSKALVLYEGAVTAHRSCGIALAEAFDRPSAAYQSLRRGGITGQVVDGRMDGRIIHEMRGSGGFGYDVVFAPEGHTCTSAELAAAEKDAISHRGKALRAMAPLVAAALLS